MYMHLCVYIKKVVVGWLFGFYDVSTFVGNLTPNPFYSNSQFYFEQF